MNNYDGAYKVVNKEWHQSLPQFFDTFEEALLALNKWDKGACIEQIVGDSVDVVWEPKYVLFISNVDF